MHDKFSLEYVCTMMHLGSNIDLQQGSWQKIEFTNQQGMNIKLDKWKCFTCMPRFRNFWSRTACKCKKRNSNFHFHIHFGVDENENENERSDPKLGPVQPASQCQPPASGCARHFQFHFQHPPKGQWQSFSCAQIHRQYLLSLTNRCWPMSRDWIMMFCGKLSLVNATLAAAWKNSPRHSRTLF